MKKTATLPLLLLSLAGCPSAGDDARAVEAPVVAPPEAPPPEATPAMAARVAPAVATVGELAPEFSLLDQAGARVSLADLRGRIVVLEWVNPECPYVKRHHEAGTMKKLAEAFGEDVIWLGVDSSHFVKPEGSEAFREANGLGYPILQDPSGEVGRRYAAKTTPHMFVIDGEGVLRYAGAIDDDPRGREETPTNYVEAAVRALLAGEGVAKASADPYGCSVKYAEN